ncbi:MAG TPA: pilin [Candidatus Paceibacterota bacterium]|nr:pilin [Candidatus Paceibacterota bacterium]
MKKFLTSFVSTIVLTVLIGASLAVPVSANPQPTNPNPPNPQPTSPGGFDIVFTNPLKADSLQCLVYDIFRIAINLLAVVAGLFIIYSGFKFVSAQGNPEKLKAARKTFLNTIIGTAIILGSWVIVQFAINTINQFMDRDVITINNTCEN